MIKTFSDIYTDVGHRLKLNLTDSGELADIKNWVNTTYRDFQTRSDWYWRLRQQGMQIIPLYETGTVDVTKNSTTITGTNTVWTSAMVGRYIRIGGENAYYKIVKYTSATSIIIDVPYVKDTATGKEYQIWKRYYNLIFDVDELTKIHSETQDKQFGYLPFVNPFAKGNPSLFCKAGMDSTITTYTTGTVSGTVNTRTITGAGTSWLDNVQKGDYFTPVGGLTYNVLSVDSDTQLTLVQNLSTVVTALDTYTIQRQDLVQVEFNCSPSTENFNVYYEYLKKTFDMINDNDEPEVPLQYRDVLILGTIAIAYQYLSIEGGTYAQDFARKIYEARITNIKAKVENERNENQSWIT